MDDLLVLGIGISQHKCDGVLRFQHFCNNFGLNHLILGDGQIWRGGNMAAGPGGGQKINQLRKSIENMENKLIIVCDTFDLFPIAGKNEIIDKFKKIHIKNHVIFSAEVFCWPNKLLTSCYPDVGTKYKYLNSGCFMGYRDDIYNLIKYSNINDNDDDQLFFTKIFITGGKIILDYECQLFQTLNGIDVIGFNNSFEYTGGDVVLFKNRIYNKYTDSYPIFIHGNGPAKFKLNYFENYFEINKINKIQNYEFNDSNNKHKIFVALYVNTSDPENYHTFMTNFKNICWNFFKIHIYDTNIIDNSKMVNKYYSYDYDIKYKYAVKNYAFDDYKLYNCNYYMLLQQNCIITDRDIIKKLIANCNTFHRIICPMMASHNNPNFTNFWGELDNNGYYKRSTDYLHLVKKTYRGLWNVPYITGCIFFHSSILVDWDLENIDGNQDIDMSLCEYFRKKTLFMYMMNLTDYGYLYDP